MAEGFTRFEYVTKAEIMFIGGRVGEVVETMKKLIFELPSPIRLTDRERVLLMQAYDKHYRSLHDAWEESAKKVRLRKEAEVTGGMFYRAKLALQMWDVCAEILKLLEENLLPAASTTEEELDYKTMRAEYTVRFSELVSIEANDAYSHALDIAYQYSRGSRLAWLKIAISSSTFCHDTLCSLDEALKIAEKADAAAKRQLKDLDVVDEEKELTELLGELTKKLNTWNAEKDHNIKPAEPAGCIIS